MTNAETIDYFIKENNERFSNGTKRAYRMVINQFSNFCKKNFDEVTKLDIKLWCAELDGMGEKATTVNFKLAAVKSLYRVLFEDNLISSDPTKEKKFSTLEVGLPHYLTQAQLVQLFELAKNDILMRTIVETLYTTGVRISELLYIKLDDINWEDKQITIRKGKGDMERIVLFTSSCKERLKKYLKERKIQSPYLFAWKPESPYSINCIRMKFENYAKFLDTDFKVTPHTMRHTFAAHLAEKGMPLRYIKYLLGHMDYQSTRIYTRLYTEARKRRLEGNY